MTKYRCVVVGCGARSFGHADAYKLVSRGELVACCDLLPEKRDKYSTQYGLRSYAEVSEMLEKEKPDLVHLVTWPQSRVELMTLVDNYKISSLHCGKTDRLRGCRLETTRRIGKPVPDEVRGLPPGPLASGIDCLSSGIAFGQAWQAALSRFHRSV